jgi:CCR4-NOT transcription complex subunit 11
MKTFQTIFPSSLFDFSICFDPDLEDLIVKASNQPLARNQLAQLISAVGVGQLFESVLNKAMGLGIVTNNPKLAVEILLSKSTAKRLIFNGCLETCTSIQTLDIIAESTKRGGSFLYEFVEKYIAKVSFLDQRQQERMAKIIFLMILSLSRAKVDIFPLKVALNSFCLQFSKIKEGLELYAILQQHS